MNKEIVKSKRSRRTESKEVRRGQLIDAAIESIARHGIRGTTTQTVTDIAGLSVGLVNFHFESKQKLFEETLLFLAREHHAEWHSAYLDAGLTAAEKLGAIADAHFTQKVASRKKLAVWYAFFGEAGRREVYRKLIDQIDDERFEISTGLCELLAQDGPYTGPPPIEVARTLEGLYDGLSLNILMYPGFLSRESARNQVRAYLATLFPHHFEMPTF